MSFSILTLSVSPCAHFLVAQLNYQLSEEDINEDMRLLSRVGSGGVNTTRTTANILRDLSAASGPPGAASSFTPSSSRERERDRDPSDELAPTAGGGADGTHSPSFTQPTQASSATGSGSPNNSPTIGGLAVHSHDAKIECNKLCYDNRWFVSRFKLFKPNFYR